LAFNVVESDDGQLNITLITENTELTTAFQNVLLNSKNIKEGKITFKFDTMTETGVKEFLKRKNKIYSTVKFQE
jgi:uncharacterized protein YdgA (DUF945 family)